MAMTSRLWSLSALAVELDMDRRTVAARLRTTPPDGMLRGNPAWRLPTALQALGGRSHTVSAPPPFGAEILAGIPSRLHAAMVLGCLTCIYATPRLVRHLAPMSGCSVEQAEELAGLATMALARHCEDRLRELKIAGFADSDPAWLNAEAMEWRPSDEAAGAQ